MHPRAARGDSSYEKRLLRFTSHDLLIINDLGLRGLTQGEPVDLHEVVRQRYERRLLHHAHVLVIVGDSYRNPPPARRWKPTVTEAR